MGSKTRRTVMVATIRISLATPAQELFTRTGILAAGEPVPAYLDLFVKQAEQALARIREEVAAGALDSEKARDFQQLLVDACGRILCHPIIASNNYLRRFA